MAKGREAIYDELLVLRAKANDSRALGELVARWHERLSAHAYRLTRNRDGADEVMQEAWIAIVRGINKLDSPAAFSMWAFRIVGRECANWVKKKQRTRRDGTEEGLEQKNANPSAKADDELVVALDKLSIEHREVLVLHYLNEQSVEEIAATLGVKAGTIKSRLHYAREMMRLALEGEAHE